MTILCEPDRQAAAALVPALDGAVHTVATLPDVAMTMAGDPAEKLVVIGRDVALDQALSFSGRVRAERPDVAVILLRDSPDAGTLTDAANAGVREVEVGRGLVDVESPGERQRRIEPRTQPRQSGQDEVDLQLCAFGTLR